MLSRKNLLANQASQFKILSKTTTTTKTIKKKSKTVKTTTTTMMTTMTIKNENKAIDDKKTEWWQTLKKKESDMMTKKESSNVTTKKDAVILPSFLQVLIKKKIVSTAVATIQTLQNQKYIIENIYSSLQEQFVGQEHVYEQFLEWILTIGTIGWKEKEKEKEQDKDICFISGPSGCGKTMFLELFFQMYNPKKYKFVSIYDYKSLDDLFSYIKNHYDRKLYKIATRPEYRIQTNDITFPTFIYIIEDIDIALAIEDSKLAASAKEKGKQKTFAETFAEKKMSRHPPMIFTSSFFKGVQSSSLRLLKSMARKQISFTPITRFPIQSEIQLYLETNGGDVRQAKLQYQFMNKNRGTRSGMGTLSDHVNIFTRIENLTSHFHWQKKFPLTTLEDAIEDDPHLVFQYFLHIYSITPSVVHSYLFCSSSPYIMLRKMMHDYGKSVVEKKFKKVEYDNDNAQLPFLVKEQLYEYRYKQFNRRQGWNQYHDFRGSSFFSSSISNRKEKHEMFSENFMSAHLLKKNN